MLDLNSKMGNVTATEKRLAEMIEADRKNQAELERLRAEKDQRTFEFQKQLEQEKETMRNRVREVEDQLKNIEREKREKYYEYEREMSKWYAILLSQEIRGDQQDRQDPVPPGAGHQKQRGN